MESFANMTSAMEQVTVNYLVQEQRLCDNWAALINSEEKTIQQEIDMVSASQAHKDDVMAHIIYVDDGSYAGISTHPKSDDPSDYTVSYAGLDLFKNVDSLEPLGQAINNTRAYINPVDGIQSIALYARVNVLDDEGRERDALLVRVVPVSVLSQK